MPTGGPGNVGSLFPTVTRSGVTPANSPYAQILNAARRGTLTAEQMAGWVMGIGPSAAQVQNVLNVAQQTEPGTDLGFTVSGGKIAVMPGNPATAPLAPGMLPGLGSSSGSGASTNDWANIFIRLAEFGIGSILIIIGLNAILSRTKVYQSAERIVTGTAGQAARAAVVK